MPHARGKVLGRRSRPKSGTAPDLMLANPLCCHSGWLATCSRACCEMDDKLKMQRALLDHLEQESEKIQSLMDELLKSMDTIPSEKRHGPAWEADTNRFLELVERSGDIARKLQLGSDAIKKGATGKKLS